MRVVLPSIDAAVSLQRALSPDNSDLWNAMYRVWCRVESSKGLKLIFDDAARVMPGQRYDRRFDLWLLAERRTP